MTTVGGASSRLSEATSAKSRTGELRDSRACVYSTTLSDAAVLRFISSNAQLTNVASRMCVVAIT